MGQDIKKLYLYLARRDKKGVEILTILHGPAVPPTRVADVERLGLPRNLTEQLKQSIHDDRMYWEPWIEAADSYADLVATLKNRGYSNVPVTSFVRHFTSSESTSHNIQVSNVTTHSSQMLSQRIPQRKTMLR